VEIIAIFVAGCGAVLAFGVAMIALGIIWDLIVAIWKIVDAILDIAIELILFPFRVVSIFIDAIFGADEEPPQRVVTYREVEEPPPPQRPQPEVRYSPPPPPQPEPRYTSDWSTVSRRYKESRNWTCERCGVYCGGEGDQSLLHVHHFDLNSLNNAERNLRALCVQCHGGMPGVGHKRLAGAAKTDGRWQAVDYLRWRQRNRR
jgi:hypothetical protein